MISKRVEVAILAHEGQEKCLEIRDVMHEALGRADRSGLAAELDSVLERLLELEIILCQIEQKAPPSDGKTSESREPATSASCAGEVSVTAP
jgi:hypothetical protein